MNLLGLFAAFIVGKLEASFVALPRRRRQGCTHRFSLFHSSGTLHQASKNDDDDLWTVFLQRFQGDFDNYNQVVQDRKAGLLPREGGGHEHIHCTLVPLSTTERLAAFYLDGQPHDIFRFRYYRAMHVPPAQAVDVFLYTLHPKLDARLRRVGDPLQWPTIFDRFDESDDKVYALPNCEVRWSYQLDSVQHAYAAELAHASNGIHAVMVHGEAVVDSQMIPGQMILIRDQLSLYDDFLYIHDRGYDPQTMDYIYGNQREVPYSLERVGSILVDSGTVDTSITALQREIVRNDIAWTLGPLHRSEAEYEAKMARIGGTPTLQRHAPAQEE